MWGIADEGRRLLDLYPDDEKPIPLDSVEAYRQNIEIRAFADDITERLIALAAAYDRLCELNQELWDYREGSPIWDSPKEGTGAGRQWHPDREWLQDEAHRWAEVDVETSFVQYELYSVTGMIQALVGRDARDCVVPPGSEVEYAIKLRDRLLTHPKLGGVVRLAARGGAYGGGGGPVHLDAGLGGQHEERFLLARLTDPTARPTERDSQEARKRNEAVIRSGTWNERLSAEQVRDILAFGARSANVERALDEFAGIVRSHFLPVVDAACSEAVTRFGLARPPEGPTTIVEIWPKA